MARFVMLLTLFVGLSAQSAQIWVRGIFATTSQLPFYGLVLDTVTGELSWVVVDANNVAEVEAKDLDRANLASLAHRIEQSPAGITPKLVRSVVGKTTEFAVLDDSGEIWLTTDHGQKVPLQFKLLNLSGSLRGPTTEITGGALATGETIILIRSDAGEMAAAIVATDGSTLVKAVAIPTVQSDPYLTFSTTLGYMFAEYKRSLKCGPRFRALGESAETD